MYFGDSVYCAFDVSNMSEYLKKKFLNYQVNYSASGEWRGGVVWDAKLTKIIVVSSNEVLSW